MTVEAPALSLEARKAFAKIAGYIERQGHYQGTIASAGPNTCCIVVNPVDTSDEMKAALLRRIGGRPDGGGWGDVYAWNDNTPTAEVLATLYDMAGDQAPPNVGREASPSSS